MTLVFQASSAQSTDTLFRRHSKTPDLTSMAAVTYQLLHRTMPLQPTYIQLQMIFRSLTWEKTSMIHPPSLEDHSSTLSKPSLEPEKSTCNSPPKKATQPKPEEANHQGRMGRLQRRCNKVQRYTS